LSAREDAIKELVRRSYEDPRVIARYTTVGLWPAEEILILEYVPDDALVLDLGCGAGRTTVALAELGLRVHGIDISPKMVDIARRQAEFAQVEVDYSVMDTMDLAFPDNSFEVAFYSYNGIELIPGIGGKLRVLAEVWRVLRPGGRLIFSSHSFFALNRFLPGRLLGAMKYCAGRFAGLPVMEAEFGERFSDDDFEEVKYLQVLPPSKWIRMLRSTGFEMRYFNNRKRIEAGSGWRFPGQFEGSERFYVARKN
jgi:SAM-dependent methyltransferase